jgi:hypothetical protein
MRSLRHRQARIAAREPSRCFPCPGPALARVILTIEEELTQKEFPGSIGDVYAAQDGFHTRIAALIESYGAKCETFMPSA